MIIFCDALRESVRVSCMHICFVIFICFVCQFGFNAMMNVSLALTLLTLPLTRTDRCLFS